MHLHLSKVSQQPLIISTVQIGQRSLLNKPQNHQASPIFCKKGQKNNPGRTNIPQELYTWFCMYLKQHLSDLQLFVYRQGKHAGAGFSCAYLHLKPPLWTLSGHTLPIWSINHTKAGLTRGQIQVKTFTKIVWDSLVPSTPFLLSLQDLCVLAEWQSGVAGVPAHLPDSPCPKALTVGAAGQGY